jgi:pyruvate formate lyase activating enzyme
MLPEIKGFIPSSLVEWQGRITSVIFLGGCNLRCPFCHSSEIVLNPKNHPTIGWECVEKYLKEKAGWVDAVVISGGEPTIHENLPCLLKSIKNIGYKIKLFTNGTNPKAIETLFELKIIDSISMDIKAPLCGEKYKLASGMQVNINNIKQTIMFIVKSGIEYEFRTTAVPCILEKQDIMDIAKDLSLFGVKKFIIQQFIPRDTLDPSFLNIKPFPDYFLKEIASTINTYIKDVNIANI